MKCSTSPILPRALAAVCMAIGMLSAHAASWPDRLVRVVVPYGAGSTPDVLTRLVFDKVTKITHGTFIIENRTGAGGMIGADVVAKSAPDGATLLVAPPGPLLTSPLLYKKMSYDPSRDLVPIALLAVAPTVLAANVDLPATNAPELLRLIADPTHRLSYATPGAGSVTHLTLAYLVSLSGGHAVHVPFRAGGAELTGSLIRNDVQFALLTIMQAKSLVDQGRLKALAAISASRVALMPDVATLREQGIDFSPNGWFSVAAPAGTPRSVQERIHAAITTAMRDPEVQKWVESVGMQVGYPSQEQFRKSLADEYVVWKEIIEKNRITAE